MKEFNTQILWRTLKNDKNFFIYFPEKFIKGCPPKNYFWHIFSIVKKDEYEKLLKNSENRLREFKKIKKNYLNLTQEALKVFEEFSEEKKLNLLSFLNSFKSNFI